MLTPEEINTLAVGDVLFRRDNVTGVRRRWRVNDRVQLGTEFSWVLAQLLGAQETGQYDLVTVGILQDEAGEWTMCTRATPQVTI